MARALAALGARRLAVGSPYPAAIHPRAVSHFQESGFEVVADTTLDLRAVSAVAQTPRSAVIDLAKSISRPNADAIVLLATDLPTFDAIEEIEASTSRPLLTCNQTILWAALGQFSRRVPFTGLGRLWNRAEDAGP